MPTVLITGANRGIGLGFVRAYAADGWRVHACCRHPEKTKALRSLEGDIHCHRLDVTDGLRVASLARELSEESIDLLINNAGVYGPRTGFGETEYEEWLDVLKANTLAPMRMTERFVDHVARSERKCIAMISSRMGSISENSGGNHIYRSSKAALNAVGKGLAADLKAQGIVVVMFHPGWVQTDMGGENATVGIQPSVAGMRSVLERVSATDSGRFLAYDGTEIPW